MDAIPAIPESEEHDRLYLRRETAAPVQQKDLAVREHRAFARQWTKENPLVAVPSLIVAIPAYTAAKATGLIKARSPASLDEVTQAYRGLYEGLTLR
jgi:hypothetical protein